MVHWFIGGLRCWDASIFLSGPCFAVKPPTVNTKTRTQGRTIGSKYFAQRATSLAQHFKKSKWVKTQKLKTPKMASLVGQ